MTTNHDHDLGRPGNVERVREPDPTHPTPETAVETTEAPDAIRAARDSLRPGPASRASAVEPRRGRGVEWVRPTDLIARHGASLAGRGIDFEVELARRTRTPITAGARQLGERARRLPPLSAFGRSSSAQTAPSPRVGMS
ncbi:MAG: hypothetical protein LCH98_15300 [Actinobacteria bacterium]|nr:hypothetical protein [Actinomycetota bacterium]